MAALLSHRADAQMVPPPPEQIGADCARPVYASDTLVCADPELRAIDRANAERSARIGVPEVRDGSNVETHQAWFRRRGRCAFERDHRGCLIEAYRDRAKVVSVLASAPEEGRRLACGGAWAHRELRLSIGDQGAMRLTENGRLVAVATPAVPNSGWTPAVASRATRATIVFSPLGAAAIRCAVIAVPHHQGAN